MKTSKSAFLVLVLMLSIGVHAWQFPGMEGRRGGRMGGGRGPGQGAMESVDDRLKKLSQELNLTDDQKSKVKSVLEQQQKKVQDLRQDTSSSREDKMAKMRSLRADTESQIRDVLDEQQQKKFDKMIQEEKDRMQSRKGRGLAG